MSKHTRPRAALTTLAALTALTSAACSNTTTHETDKAPPPPPPSTATGTDVRACADGDCEVTVTEPVTLHFPGPDGVTRATLSVTEVAPDKIEYEVKSGSTRSHAGASGPGQGCLTYLRTHGSGNSCGTLDNTRPSPQPDAVLIQATTSTAGPASLHIVSP